VWGLYPWFEAAFVGGRASLRGYSRQRFAGDSSLYAGLEARAWLFTMDVPPVPLRVGVLGFGDTGRVWLDGETSDGWHASWGGGLMLQPVATPFVLTVAAAASNEGTRWYFGYGFFF
jgi:outer membrane protein assembly factor BamA